MPSYNGGNGGKKYGGYSKDNNNRFEEPVVVPQLPKIQFYADSTKKIVNPELFSAIAKNIASCFGTKMAGVSSTQLRRIFDEVKRFEQLVGTDDDWKKQEAYIRMLSSKVSYTVARAKLANGRDRDYLSRLQEFIETCLKNIQTKEDFKVFVALFEATYGFYYEIKPKDKN